MTNLLAVALGGAIGSVLRYLLAEWGQNWGQQLPWGTLAANLTGCFLIGLLSVVMVANTTSQPLRLAVLIGILGGFTTFSSFGWQTFSLMEEGRWLAASLYVLATNVGGLCLAWAGYSVGLSLRSTS